jgi:hypothetical protein
MARIATPLAALAHNHPRVEEKWFSTSWSESEAHADAHAEIMFCMVRLPYILLVYRRDRLLRLPSSRKRKDRVR